MEIMKSYNDYFMKLKGGDSKPGDILGSGGTVSINPSGDGKRSNLNNYRFDGESDVLASLEDEVGLRQYYNIFEDHKEVAEIRQGLLGNSVKMNEILAPRLYRICREVSEKTGYLRNIEFYISSSPDVNALSIHGAENEADIIVLTSSLIKLMTDDELKFVIGHELGHLVFCHSKPNITYFKVSGGKDNFNPIGNNLKLRWDIYSEVSADRIGFFAVGDIKIVGSAFFKLASGLSEEHLNFNLEAYMRQLDDINPEKSGISLSSSHPANLIRLKCLELFISSTQYSQFAENGTMGISDKALSEDTRNVLMLMEVMPDNEVYFESAKMLGSVGAVMAHSEENLIEKQYRFVYSLLLHYTTIPELFLDFEDAESALKTVEECCTYWADKNNSDKFHLFQWLIRIALEDNKFNDNERAFINDVGTKMKISEKDIADYTRQVITEKNR